MDDRCESPRRRNGPLAVACAVLVVLTLAGCGTSPAPTPTPARSEDDREETQAPAQTQTQSSPQAQPQTAQAAEVSPPTASLAELREHALAVRTYGAEAPSRCGLENPSGGTSASSVQVFFGCTPQSGPVIGAVPARVVPVPSGSKPEQVAVEALLAGPTAQERQAGYVANFGDASRGVGFQVELRNDGTAVINFDQAIRERARAFVSNLDARQVVATLGQFPGVERVLILVEGEPLCKALGEC